MTRTVRINRDRLWASTLIASRHDVGLVAASVLVEAISHTPREYSDPDACAKGTDVLVNAVLRLADQP
jgi:acetylornithine deacetylase/succinyl-diaminopimelate desuccinylase-like protein